MATDDVQVLRRLVDEPDETNYTDNELATRLSDNNNDANAAALGIWREKLAGTASFVDVSEGGSSRRMSQAHDNALKMVQYFEGRVDSGGTGAPVIRRLARS